MKSRAYELIVREIYQQILDQDNVPNIVVEHDVLKQGIATEHQIDVYWELSLGGIVHKVAIQAKRWARPVNKGELLKFKGVLDDVPGTIGIVITTRGYQRGALEVAAKYGITICELREELPPTPLGVSPGDTMTLTIKGIRMAGDKHIGFAVQQVVIHPEFSDVLLQADLRAIGVPESSVSVPDNPLKLELLTDEGRVKCTLHEILGEMASEVIKAGELQARKTRSLDPPLFVKVSTIPAMLKIASVSADIFLRKRSQEIEMRSKNVAIFILQNLADGTRRQFAVSDPRVKA